MIYWQIIKDTFNNMFICYLQGPTFFAGIATAFRK